MMAQQVSWFSSLFTKTIKAAGILNTDKELVIKIKETINHLPPMQIGQWANTGMDA